MVYRVAIVEDETQYQKMFKAYVEKYATDKNLDIRIDIFRDGLDITENYEPKWDIILLDIKMQQQDGMSAAHIIREHDSKVLIMFITTLSQYAINGYEVGAMDYVLKPVEYEKFAFRFDRLIGNVKNTEDEYLMLPSEDGKDRVYVSEIKYITVDHHNLEIYIQDKQGRLKEYVIRKSISAMENDLKDKGFFRCDHSTIVNIKAIDKVQKDTVMIGEKMLPISRSRKKAFLEAIAKENM